MIELVVMDLAGTTVFDGDAVNDSFRASLAASGIAADPAFVNTVMGLHKPDAIRILIERAGRTPTAREVETVHDDFVKRMSAYYTTNPAVREIPGASEVFVALRKAGIKVALNTGFNRAVTDVLLNRLGWSVPDKIDAVITSDEVTHGRPQPDMIRALMDRLGIREPRAVAKIGDTRADLEEGTNAGCGLVIGVTTGSYTQTELEPFPHTNIVTSVAEVPALVLSRT